MKVICEKCGSSYDIENQRIPPSGMTMKCPKCLGSFRVQRPAGDAGGASESLSDDQKFFIRRHTGSVFGPFAQSAIMKMAADAKLDGSEDISPDKASWTKIADNPAFAAVFADTSAGSSNLPAPVGAKSPLPNVPRAAKPVPLDDLPTPAAIQPAKLGVPSPPRSLPPIPEIEDLPTPSGTPAPRVPMPRAPSSPRAAITPPPPEIEDLPTPSAKTPAPRVPLPRAPSSPRAAITPPPPEMPDLPTPKGKAPSLPPRPPASKPPIAPPPPEMPDLPAPKGAQDWASTPELPTPAHAGPVTLPGTGPIPPTGQPELPDLPTPLARPGAQAGIPDLPTPKAGFGAQAGLPDLPSSAPGAGDIAELPTPSSQLPTPKRGAGDIAELPTPSSQLPTPREGSPREGTADADSDGMSYGEVDLSNPGEIFSTPGAESASPPNSLLNLSELDLLTPKGDVMPAPAAPEAADDVSDLDLLQPKGKRAAEAAQAIDVSEMDLPQPKATRAARAAPAEVDGVADLLEADAEVSPSARAKRRRTPAPASGDRLLGLPKRTAALILGGAVLLLVALAVVFWPRKKPTPAERSPTAKTKPTPEPVAPDPTHSGSVPYAPSMDLDTHQGYQAARKAYRSQLKKKPSISLKAAQAKAILCSAYRFGVTKRLANAQKALEAIEQKTDVEYLKARALQALHKGKLKPARKRLRQAYKQAKDDPEIHVFLGWVELEAANRSAAEKAFRRAIKYRGESAAALYGLARSLEHPEEQGSLERNKLLAKAVKLSPRHVEAQIALLAATPVGKIDAGIGKLQGLLSRLEDQGSPRELALLSYGLGLLQRRVGKLDSALSHLGRAAQKAPQDARIMEAHAEALLAAGDTDRAVVQFTAALKLAPREARVLEGLVRAHLAHGQATNADDAVHAFVQGSKGTPKKRPKNGAPLDDGKRARKIPALPEAGAPRSPYVALAKGRVAMALGNKAEAKNFFLESTSDTPRFTPGHVAYLEWLLQTGQLEGMKNILELIKRKYHTDLPAALRNVEGRLLLAQGRAKAAAQAFRAALVRDPHNNDVSINLARCLWRQLKKPEEGYLLLQQVYRRAKSLTRVVVLLASYHFAHGEKDRGFQRFEEALKINHARALRRRYAEFLLRSPNEQQRAKAESLLSLLLKENSRDHASIALFSLVELGRGQHKQAMAKIKRALITQPKNRQYLIYRAMIASASGDPKAAARIYEDLLKTRPKDLQVMTLRARLFCRHRDTRRCLSGALAIQKLSPGAEGHLLAGLAYLQLRRSGQAIKSFQKAIAQQKRHAYAHFLLGRTFYDDAAYRKALTGLLRSQELAEETAVWWSDIHYFLGMSYYKIRNTRLAHTHLRKYLSTKGNPDNPETGAQRLTAQSSLKRP
ncbi:MAG: tetratricopeptide repeat protein [bacterium]